jgi:uncharacterized protein (TIGR02147 family)
MTEISPFIFSSHTEYLKAIRDSYGERKRPIPLKAWAQRLGYRTARSLELILSGDRLPSEDMLRRIQKDLKLSEYEYKYFQMMVQKEKRLRKNKSVIELEEEMALLRPQRLEARYISNEIFRRVSEWYPLVIRQLGMTTKFKNDISWIAKKLRGKVTTAQIHAALAEWQGLAYDRRSLYTNEDIPSDAVRTFHKKMLQKAIEAVDEVEVDNREYISLTIRGSKKDLPALKKKLREVRDQLNQDSNRGDETEVFQVCIAFFPHTDLKS